MIWDRLREEEFEESIKRSGGVCVIPLGCLEKHGQHLPVGCDYLETMHIIDAAAAIEDVMIFPVGAFFGEVSCFHAFKNPGEAKLRGCIGIKQETLLMLLSELCEEIARNGFNKILVVNGHGGNTAMLRHFIRMQSYESKNYATLSTSAFAFSETAPKRLLKTINARKKDFPYITDDDLRTLEYFSITGTGGGHADIRETALMMSYDESLVAQDRYDAESGKSTRVAEAFERMGIDYANLWLSNFPSSYEALAPYGASKTIGDAMLTICAERLAKIFHLIKTEDAPLDAAKMGNHTKIL